MISSTRRWGVLLLAAALSSAPGCFLWRQPAGSEERPNVLSFEIEGTKAISEGALVSRLVTQPSSRSYFIAPKPSFFDADAFANDKRRILRYYQSRGYYQVKITRSDQVPDGRGFVKLKLRVEEGAPVRVAQVEVLGLEEAPQARERLRRLALKQGEVFTEEAYDAARAEIQRALEETGFARATVVARAQIDLQRDEARVTYEASPGARYRFGNSLVAGAAAIPRARIRDEAEAVANPGTTFDVSKLPKLQARVFDLGAFGGVRVSQGAPDEQRRAIPIVVSVREAPFRTVRAGPGLTFQATRWQADAMAGWSHRNWLGGLRKLNLDARIGYAWLPTFFNAQTQGLVGLVSADFTQPELISRYVDLNVHAELERGREQAYDFFAERLRFSLPSRLGRIFSFSPSLNLELYHLGGAIGVPDATTGQQLQLSTCPGHDPNLCLLSYFEQRLAVDLRDNPLNTTSGFYFEFSVQEGFSVAGSGANYLRFSPEVRAFVSPLPRTVLAGRLRLGFIDAEGGGDLPLVALFTSGGPSAMRGYYTRQLAPTVLACPSSSTTASGACSVAEEYVPVGGAGLVEGGVELRFPVTGQLGGAAFLDFGNVTYAARDAFDLTKIQYAVGLGARYMTVIGPLRLDVAARLPQPGGGQPGVEQLSIQKTYNVAGDPSSGVKYTRLTPNGAIHHDPIVSVHLSIGEAF